MNKYFSYIAIISCLCATATSPALGAWAVALAPGGQPIVARALANVGQAEQSALTDCNNMFKNCEIVASARSGCLALAIAGKKWGVGEGSRKKAASEAALAACDALNAGPCKVVHTFCGS